MIVLVLALIIYAILKPSYADYTDRANVVRLMATTTVLREEINKEILAKKENIQIDPYSFIDKSPNTTYVDVSSSGKVTIYSQPLSVFVVFTPKLENDKVSWVCSGLPKRDLPTQCR